MGWLGIRGIGSLYYLAYCVNHGLDAGAAHDICRIVLTVLILSIALHGLTAQPLISRYERMLRRRAPATAAPRAG
jgi:NhaP-type Na+/H+ or K+/H+ antiporter